VRESEASLLNAFPSLTARAADEAAAHSKPEALAAPHTALDVPTAAAELLSDDFPRLRRALERTPVDRRLVPLIIPLLRHSELVEQVTSVLKSIATSVQGQLLDALLDPHQSLVVRRRIPRVLRVVESTRTATGLALALNASEREVRYRSALALTQLTALRPELGPEPRAVFESVREELRLTEGEPLPLQHIFALLGLALERDAVRLARRALVASDPRQRGTALEYLQNVLPEPLRSELISRLEHYLSRYRPSLPPPPSTLPPE
jgi:hypothetical protein